MDTESYRLPADNNVRARVSAARIRYSVEKGFGCTEPGGGHLDEGAPQPR